MNYASPPLSNKQLALLKEQAAAAFEHMGTVRGAQAGAAVIVSVLLLGSWLRARKARRRKVAVFGLSADPPTGTKGHKAIVKRLSQQFDEVWVLPVYEHAYASKQGRLAPFEHRVNMCRIAFANVGQNVHVLDAEREAAEQRSRRRLQANGTYGVVMYLRQKHPDAQLHWVVGADAYVDICDGKWSHTHELLHDVNLLVVPRDDVSLPPLSERASELHVDTGNVSSTHVRSQLAAGAQPHEHVVDSNVASYAVEHKLYTAQE